jgi:hypothetical protein
VTIPANGEATLTVRGFCLDYGEPFPTGDTNVSGLADERIRAALNYAITAGHTEGNPQQTELAIWFLRDGQWRADEHVLAQQVVDNATTANAPNDQSDGTALHEAVRQNQVSVTARFVAQTQDNFYGDGEAVVRNLTNAEVKVYMPVGVVFTAAGGGNFQDLVAYELGTEQVQVQDTPVVSGSPTVTLAPAVTPTVDRTAPAPTEAPTQAPTEAPTQAPAPTEEAAPIATAQPTPTQDSLPRGGVGDDPLVLLLVVGLALALGTIALGGVLRKAPR